MIAYLSVKDTPCFTGVGWITEDKAGRNVFLFYSLKLNFDVLSRSNDSDFVFIRPQLVNYHRCLNRSGNTNNWNVTQTKWWRVEDNTLLGRTSKVWPFLASPASTFPNTTVPMSLYLSTMGMMNGRSTNLNKGGISSSKGMNGKPLKNNWFQL